MVPCLACNTRFFTLTLVTAGSAHAFRRQRFTTMSTHEAPDVLVIGGTGLMGAPTARRLQAQGHRVQIMSRGASKGMGSLGNRPEQADCEKIICDREDKDTFLRVLSSSECPRVIVDFTAMQPDHIRDIIKAHRQRKIDHYIFISTNMVYPGGIEDMDITGLPQPVPESFADLGRADAAPDTYGGKKLKCEALLRQALQDDGLPSTTLRPPAVVGPGCDDRHERLQRLVAGLAPLPPRKGKRPPTVNPGLFRVAHSSDVAEVVAAVVARGKEVHGETFNVASSESVTLQEYVAAIAEHLGEKTPNVPDDASYRNYERQGVLDISKTQRLLGYKGSTLSQWMGDTVKWHSAFLA